MDDEREESSWRDDLRVEAVQEFLRGAVGDAGVAEMEMPHIVVCLDEETGSVSYSGPFPDGLTALVFAERESAVDRELNDGPQLLFSVAALYPTDPGAAG
ncbi:hypothetical protein ABIE44_002836 [Marmoricola sp. OAE513]|uniref:hypothetical protein n=1 Tax=Marmoricola sp. OAE513 TaxID=2817894 RepID=UPI001AE646F5